MTTSTRERFEAIRAKRPDITTSEMGDELGVTRQRASALAKQLGVTLGGPPDAAPRPCRICGKPLDRHAKEYHAACYLKLHTARLRCRGCGVRFDRTLRERNRHPGAAAFHSRECFQDWRARERVRKAGKAKARRRA